jgi:hypothetical protein
MLKHLCPLSLRHDSQPSYIPPYKLLASMAPPFLLPFKRGGIIALECFLMSYHFNINVARRREEGRGE